MAPFIITVEGRATVPRKAERAVLDIEIWNEGTKREEVAESVASSAKQLQALLKDLSTAQKVHNPDPPFNGGRPFVAIPVVAKWTMESFTSTSQVPRDDNYQVVKDAERVHTVSVSFDIQVRDFTRLGGLISDLATQIPHVKIHELRWILTEQTQESCQAELRRLCSHDAMRRAQDYASAFLYQEVHPLEISEVLRDSDRWGGPMAYAAAPKLPRAAARGNTDDGDDEQVGGFEGMVFVPEDIELTASIECKFEAVLSS